MKCVWCDFPVAGLRFPFKDRMGHRSMRKNSWLFDGVLFVFAGFYIGWVQSNGYADDFSCLPMEVYIFINLIFSLSTWRYLTRFGALVRGFVPAHFDPGRTRNVGPSYIFPILQSMLIGWVFQISGLILSWDLIFLLPFLGSCLLVAGLYHKDVVKEPVLYGDVHWQWHDRPSNSRSSRSLVINCGMYKYPWIASPRDRTFCGGIVLTTGLGKSAYLISRIRCNNILIWILLHLILEIRYAVLWSSNFSIHAPK